MQNRTFSLNKALKFSRIRPRKQVSIGTLFGVVALVLYVGYHAGKKSGSNQVASQPVGQQLAGNLSNLRQENELLKQQLVNEKRNFQIHQEAQKNLSQHIKELEQHNSELSQDVALYERLRGSPSKKNVEIKTFHIFSTDSENKYRYLLLLSKDSNPEQLTQGSVQMKIFGRLGSENIELPVRYADASYQGIAFKFRNFQELSGELSFPDGFVPDSVSFEIKPLAGGHFQQQFPWDNQHIYRDQS
jgi:hypothetical protein